MDRRIDPKYDKLGFGFWLYFTASFLVGLWFVFEIAGK
jgi:hypothetical protein